MLSFEIMNISSPLILQQAVAEIEKCNDFTSQFGLMLAHRDAVELVETRALALKNNGRIEFGGGVLDKIIREFCHSPYISMYNYAETLHDLTEIFYFYKNETLDLLSDDDLLKFMKDSFDGKCQGSLELLAGRALANMARQLRYGDDMNESEPLTNAEEDEDDEY